MTLSTIGKEFNQNLPRIFGSAKRCNKNHRGEMMEWKWHANGVIKNSLREKKNKQKKVWCGEGPAVRYYEFEVKLHEVII